MTQNEMLIYDSIVGFEIATPDELNLARNLMNGTWTDVLNAVIFARTGFRTLDQFIAYELEEGE